MNGTHIVAPQSTSLQTTRTNKQIKDLQGQIFGRLTVIAYAGLLPPMQRTSWYCECACGTRYVQVKSQSLLNGSCQSCGCLWLDRVRDANSTHGEGGKLNTTPEYKAYYAAHARCKDLDDPDYGGRGIQFRFTSYEVFLNHIGRRPSSKHSLDRIDNEGHYEVGNVKWSTKSEQMRNRRFARILTDGVKTQCLQAWADDLGINASSLSMRISYGWCEPCSVTLPKGQSCIHR
jgi:hypothetical protein